MNRRIFLSYCGIAATGAASTLLAKSTPERKIIVPGKKGIGLAVKQGSGWQKKIKMLDLNWHYSWGLKIKEGYPDNVRFVPMTWGKWGIEKAVAYLNEQKKAGRIDSVLGFNEPDGKDQSNIPVEKALELWPALMKANVRLGAPACVHPDNDWMKAFMEQAKKRKLRVDFVPIHDYGGPSSKGLINKCKRIHEMYGKPVWITEFAVGDWNAKNVSEHKHKPKQVLKFMKAVLPELDKLKCVERYAWFPAKQDNRHLGTSALFKNDGSLTELGSFYAKHKSIVQPKPSKLTPAGEIN